MPARLLALFSREAAGSQARLYLALLHASALYLRLAIYNECLWNSKERTVTSSLVPFVGGGPGCQLEFLLCYGCAIPQSEPEAVAMGRLGGGQRPGLSSHRCLCREEIFLT